MKYETGLFIYNGTAGSEDMEEKLSLTLPVISKAVKSLTVLQTETLQEARDAFRHFSDKVEIMIILGGDGTLHECINSIAPLKKRPVIAILPGGTCNDFSRMLNMPQELYQAAKTIVSGEVVNVDLGVATDRYFLNFWGIGLVAETSQKNDREQKKHLGVLSYFMNTLKSLNQTAPFSYKITADGKEYQDEGVLVLVLNGKFIGTRQIPIQTISAYDGKLDILVVKHSMLASFRELLTMNIANNDTNQLNELTHFRASTVKIETESKKEIDMDGEIDGFTPAEISVLPGHIQMIRNPVWT
ncbi:YegS/Rv2252/BmrU family lipid kinase [Virgibacillus kekensis]|uniref:YegS/Rv2252/BmrU family lipid kinase n=1 Tax=Virgibacillus kekensis TaxID=202261 RepID=A0ABV9DNJ1_9BACI